MECISPVPHRPICHFSLPIETETLCCSSTVKFVAPVGKLQQHCGKTGSVWTVLMFTLSSKQFQSTTYTYICIIMWYSLLMLLLLKLSRHVIVSNFHITITAEAFITVYSMISKLMCCTLKSF